MKLEECVSAYFESCDIWHLLDQRFARYNFVDIRTLYWMCILLYVVPLGQIKPFNMPHHILSYIHSLENQLDTNTLLF